MPISGDGWHQQPRPDEGLDHGACVARRDACSGCELPSGDWLYQPGKRLQQCATNSWRHVENRCSEIHVSKPIYRHLI